MTNSRKLVGIMTFTLIALGVFNYLPTNAKIEINEYKDFIDCRGSGDPNDSCSEDGATVFGCTPDPDFICRGKLRPITVE